MNDRTPQEVVAGALKSLLPREGSPAPAWQAALARLHPLVRSFLLVVGVPTLIAALYYGLIASDLYVSETRYAIRTGEQAAGAGVLTALLGSGTVSRSTDDSQIVRDYILSRDMLDALQARLQLREHYSSGEVDWLSRLPLDASEEDFLEYYRHMVGISVDGATGISVLRVRAFEPEIARRIAATLIELSEDLVNRLSDRIIEDTLKFARRELDLAEKRVREASEAVTAYRNQSRSIDPGEETSAVMGIVAQIEAQLAQARAELSEALTFMRPDSARVKSLRARVDALAHQADKERQRFASEGDTDLAKLIYGYEPLILNQKLAEQLYTSALSSLEVARADAQRRQRYLIAFVQPELPDEPLEPLRIWNVLTVLFGASLVFAIGGLIWAAVRDHAGV
jgi:capsular polysaccharide transport system permease protein